MKTTRSVTRLLCALFAAVLLMVPMAASASGSDVLQHVTNNDVKSFADMDGTYDINHTDSIRGIAWNVVQINSSLSVNNMKNAYTEVINNNGNKYWQAFDTAAGASKLMLAIESKGTTIQPMLTVGGKYATYGNTSSMEEVMFLDMLKTEDYRTVDAASNPDAFLNSYIVNMVNGSFSDSSRYSYSYDDAAFDLMMKKWCDKNKQPGMYAKYSEYKNAPGSPTFFVIEVYYIAGSYETTGSHRAILGNASSLFMMNGVSSDDLWLNKNYTSAAAYSQRLHQLGDASINMDGDKLSRLNNAISYFATEYHSTGGSFKRTSSGSLGDYPSGVKTMYGRTIILPAINSMRSGCASSVSPLSDGALKFDIRGAIDTLNAATSEWGYNNYSVNTYLNNSDRAKLESILNAARYEGYTADDQINFRNIRLEITVTPNDSSIGYVGGWILGFKDAEDLRNVIGAYEVGDDYNPPELGQKVIQRDGKRYAKTDPYMLNGEGDNTYLKIGSDGSPSGIMYNRGVVTDAESTLYWRNESICEWLDLTDYGRAYESEAYNSSRYKHNFSDLQFYNPLNAWTIEDRGYRIVGFYRDRCGGSALGTDTTGDTQVGRFTGMLVHNPAGALEYIPFVKLEGRRDSTGVHTAIITAPITTQSGTIEYGVQSYHQPIIRLKNVPTPSIEDFKRDTGKFDGTWVGSASSTSYANIDVGPNGKKDIANPNRADYTGYDENKLNSYKFVYHFSPDGFMDYLNSGGLQFNWGVHKDGANNDRGGFTVSGSISIVDNKGLNVPSGSEVHMNYATATGSVTMQAETITKWKFSTPIVPRVYAEIKAGMTYDEDFDTMSGVPTTENLWVGVGADQYSLTMSGAIIQFGRNNYAKDGENTPYYVVPDGTRLNANIPGVSIGSSYPASSLPYSQQMSQLIAFDSSKAGEYSAGASMPAYSGTVFGKLQSNPAIYRTTGINVYLTNCWGTNEPCGLVCDGHDIGSCTGDPGNGNDGTTKCSDTCSHCGEAFSHSKVWDCTKTHTDETTGANLDHSDSLGCAYHYDCTHSCSSGVKFNCKTGEITKTGKCTGYDITVHSPDETTHNQSYYCDAGTFTCPLLTEKSSEVKNTTIIDDGWTKKGSYGCACDLTANMNHVYGDLQNVEIIETYDMYIVRTLENWEVYSFLGASITDMDPLLFKDTVEEGKKYGYKATAGGDGDAYGAVATLPFGVKIWKTGAAYNGWVDEWRTDYPTGVVGEEELRATYGESHDWYEKRNGRIWFSGTDQLYNWDGTDDTAVDSKCPACYSGNRNYCLYHTDNDGNGELAGVDNSHYTTNYWCDILGDQHIDINVAYDSTFIRDNYTSTGGLHSDPKSVLKNACNCAGIVKNKAQAFDRWSSNVAYTNAGDEECWAWKISSGWSSGTNFYLGDIQLAGCPAPGSTKARAYMIDALNLWQRYNAYLNGDPNGPVYGYSAFCVSDVMDVGFMEDHYGRMDLIDNQMISDFFYRIGNNCCIYGADFTGFNQVHVYNHYSQYDVEDIKYAAVQCWIGDSSNPVVGSNRRHIDNLGTQMYRTGYSGRQSEYRYSDFGEEFHSDELMTLIGQSMRRDSNIAVFAMAGAEEGLGREYAGHGDTGSDFGNGDRSGYYAQCYSRQCDPVNINNPSTYKYGIRCLTYVSSSEDITRWSQPGYWNSYPNTTIAGDYAWGKKEGNIRFVGEKVMDGSPMCIYYSRDKSNATGLCIWNNEKFLPEWANTEWERFLKFKQTYGKNTPWYFYCTDGIEGKYYTTAFRKGDNFPAYYPSDSGLANATSKGKYAYGIINNITMWPFAPNGTYTNPVTVKAMYYPFARSLDKLDKYPLIRLKISTEPITAMYTDTYTNEAGIQCNRDVENISNYIAVVNDIVVHNPVSAQYSTVVTNGMSGPVPEISGFIDESGKDMRFGTSNTAVGGVIQQYENLAENQKHDYWVIGNTANIWVSDLGDFQSNSSVATRFLSRPTVQAGVGRNVYGTKLGSDGKLHINNPNLNVDEYGNPTGLNNDWDGGGYANGMLTSQWIFARYVKFPCAVTFVGKDSAGNKKTYVVEKDTWINLNMCTPTSDATGSDEMNCGLDLIMADSSKLKYAETTGVYGGGVAPNDVNVKQHSSKILKPYDPQPVGMTTCASYKNFYDTNEYYSNDPSKDFQLGFNYTFRLLASAQECIDGTVEFYSMGINDAINYEKISKWYAAPASQKHLYDLNSADVDASINALNFKQASNISRTPSNMGTPGATFQDPGIVHKLGSETGFYPDYRDGFMADSGAYKFAKIDIVGRIGNLALEDVADFRFSNLFKKATDKWLIEGVIREVDQNTPNIIGATPLDIYGYRVGSTQKATDGVTDIIISHSVYNVSRYTGIDKVTSENGYRTNNAGKADTLQGNKTWFSLPLMPKHNVVDEYKTQAAKMGYDAFFDIETLGNYYGNNGTYEGPNYWDTTKADYGDSRKQAMTIIPHYIMYDYITGEWVDDIKIWYGSQNNYVLCYDRGNTINDDTSALYQNVGEEQNRRNVSGGHDYVGAGSSYSEGGMTRFVESLKTPLNNFNVNALSSGTRWIGNSSRIVLDGFDRDFIGSWYLYQKTNGQGYDSSLGQKVLSGSTDSNNYTERKKWGLADANFASQSQRWYFKIGLPSSAYISTSTFVDPDTGATRNVVDGGNINQAGIVYSHEQLQAKHPHSVLMCYLDIKVTGEIYNLRYKGTHGTDIIEVFDPNTPNKPGDPTPDNPGTPPGTPPWTPPNNEVPQPGDPNPPPTPPEWEPVITYDPWDNSSTDLATYGTH